MAVRYKVTLDYEVAAPSGWTFSEVTAVATEKGQRIAGQIDGERGGLMVLASVCVAGLGSE